MIQSHLILLWKWCWYGLTWLTFIHCGLIRVFLFVLVSETSWYVMGLRVHGQKGNIYAALDHIWMHISPVIIFQSVIP